MAKARAEISSWVIEPLGRSHDRASFDCGEPALNDFLRALARQQQEKHVGRTFVAVPAPGARTVLGFYTISAGSIRFENLPRDLQRRLPRYPVPVARLGRLAVDRSMHGKGLGAALLRDALLRVARVAATELGILGVVVDAKNAEAKKFYERYGFVPLADPPLTLVILTRTILEAVAPLKK
jgi:GNAT superfamily N-acetyltransferase